MEKSPSSNPNEVKVPYKTARSYACGKAIVCGEHAVVYGAKALALPLPSLRLELTLTPQERIGSENKIEFSIGDKPVSSVLHGTLTGAIRYMGLPEHGFKVSGHSTLPSGAGLGASASLSVAVLRLIAHATGQSVSNAEIAGAANELERRFHGNPSGLDTAVVSHETPIVFSKQRGACPIERRKPAGIGGRFVLIDSGVRASTLSMIHLAKPHFAKPEPLVDRFDQATDMALKGWQDGDIKALAEGMNETNKLLTKIGVVSDRLADIIHSAKHAGSVAAKSTGAGGGGVVLALVPEESFSSTESVLSDKFGKANVYPVL